MGNYHYLIIFNGYSIFWGVFTTILSYLDPKMAVNSQNTSQGGCIMLHSIVLYRPKSNLGDVDGEFAIFSDF